MIPTSDVAEATANVSVGRQASRFGFVFEAVALEPVALELVDFAAAPRAVVRVLDRVAVDAAFAVVPPAAAFVPAVVFASATRALPAAVFGPASWRAFEAATLARAALAAAALPVARTLPPASTGTPPSAAVTLRASRLFRRAAAFGWIAPVLAARSSADIASASATAGSPS